MTKIFYDLYFYVVVFVNNCHDQCSQVHVPLDDYFNEMKNNILAVIFTTVTTYMHV